MTQKGEPARILLIDDEAPFREDLAEILREEGLKCQTVESAEDGMERARENPPDLILCDIVMPDMGGLEALEQFQKVCPQTGVFMVTAYGNLDSAVEAFRQGAYDYLTKPVNPDEVLEKINRYLDHRRLANEVDRLRREVSRPESSPGEVEIIGDSEPMKRVFERIKQAGNTESNVLVTGETGTGKELVARSIHDVVDGEDEKPPFVAVNCAALTESLLESELFGHTEGAFTGATGEKKGYFEEADGGTLFLDEISEMNVDLQSKLLRAIERKEIQRVGSTETIPVDARIIASSNRDLESAVQQEEFREDLYYRLNVLHIQMPPLRSRREDIPLLVDHFIKEFNQKMNRKVLGAENTAIQSLMTYDWPGNVRELENVVERWMIVCSDDVLKKADLPGEIRGSRDESRDLPDDLKQAVDAYEKQHIRRVLESSDGNRSRAAERMGIDPSTLYRKLEKHSLSS